MKIKASNQPQPLYQSQLNLNLNPIPRRLKYNLFHGGGGGIYAPLGILLKRSLWYTKSYANSYTSNLSNLLATEKKAAL